MVQGADNQCRNSHRLIDFEPDIKSIYNKKARNQKVINKTIASDDSNNSNNQKYKLIDIKTETTVLANSFNELKFENIKQDLNIFQEQRASSNYNWPNPRYKE